MNTQDINPTGSVHLKSQPHQQLLPHRKWKIASKVLPCYACWWPALGSVSTLRCGQKGQHLQDIFKCIFVKHTFFIFIEIALKFIPEARIYISPHWCMQWHGTEWVISLYLIWWWPYLLMHKSSIRLQGIKIHHLISSWCLCLYVYEMKQLYPEMFHLTYNIFEYPRLLYMSI